MSEEFKYRWKDEVAPELNNDFKWRFAMDALKPKMQIEGPSVGSLLYAMNPKTSELGLKQMDSELNQQLAANANFDKRGDAAMKFMEQRVAEDIANKQFADKMDMERIKAQNVDAGHVNSLMSNYVNALNTGNADAISLIENQIKQTLPNAEQIIEQGKETAAKSKVQETNYLELLSQLPNKWDSRNDRNNFITSANGEYNDGKISQKQFYDLQGKANQLGDWNTEVKFRFKNQGIQNALNKSQANTFNARVDELMKDGMSRSDAETQAKNEGLTR
jgi:hypothetical protein